MKRILALCLSLLLLSGCTAVQTPKQQPEETQQNEEQTEEQTSEKTQQETSEETVSSEDEEKPSEQLEAEEAPLTWVTDLPKVSFVPDWTVESSSEEFFLELSDPKYQGRVTGSAGNRAAADYIEEQFVRLGLQQLPDLESYRQSFYSPVFEVVPGEAWVVSADGTQTPLTQGKDWVFRASYEAVDLTLPMSENISDCEAGRAFLDAKVTQQNTPRQYIDVISGDVEKGIAYFNPKDYASRIMVTEEVYAKLKQYGTKLRLKLPAVAKRGEADNVVGFFPGEDSTKAVVLGAHFDGVGQCGSVMPGAYDNASGVATLIQTAAWLSKADSLPCDVIVVAFNTEEIDLNGSRSFANLLADQYEQILMINIDCVGWKGEPSAVFGAMENSNLRNELAGGLGIPFKNEVYAGDQFSFQQRGIPAVTISQGDWNKKECVHSTYDIEENLDPKQMDELAKDLSAWVIERGSDAQERYPVFW